MACNVNNDLVINVLPEAKRKKKLSKKEKFIIN